MGGQVALGQVPRTAWLDLCEGVASSVVTLPLSLGLTLASGLPVQYGLYSAIVGGFVASVAASKPIQAVPAVALIAVTGRVFTKFGPQGVAAFTAATGLWLVFLDMANLTSAVTRLPVQVRLGLRAGFILVAAMWLGRACLSGPGGWRVAATLLGVTAFLIIVGARTVGRVIATLGAIGFGTVAARILARPLANLASGGGVLAGLPAPDVPALAWASVEALTLPALAAAVLCAIESQEREEVPVGTRDAESCLKPLTVLGLASVASSLFGGVPAKRGPLPHGWVRERSGLTTPSAGIIHAVALAGAPLVLGPTLGLIPVPVLGGVALAHILTSARWVEMGAILRRPRREGAACVVAAATFVALDASAAVLVAVLVSAAVVSREHQRWNQTLSSQGSGRAH